MDYGTGYKVPLIVRILSRFKIITFKGFNFNKAYISIGNLEAKVSKVKFFIYITFLYNIFKVIFKLSNLIENTSDFKKIGYNNNNNNNRNNNKGNRA